MKPPELREMDAARILDLDVRADLREGREPFQRIMEARADLGPDQVLRLRAIFEPRPLYGVLGREGFRHWTERLAEDDWRIWFYRDPETGEPAGPGADDDAAEAPTPGATGRRLPNCGAPAPGQDDLHSLDVRGLEPPEPMVRTLEALEDLPRGHTLVQLNVRVPRFLLPELETRGFTWTVHQDSDELVRVAIRHAGETPVLDVRLIPSREKHPAIFRTFEELGPGQAFVLLNDHDPLPLRYQFQAERPGTFSWEYLEEGPDRWRVRIGRKP